MAQLSLSLDPESPHLPDAVPPMSAHAGDLPHDAERWLADPLWGGVRAIALAEPGRVRVVDASGREMAETAELLPALTAVARDRLVLDGEWLPTGGDRGGVFVAWDLLWHAGRPLLARPLVRRRALLRQLAVRPPVLAPPPLAGDLVDCLAAVEREGLPGLLVRRLDSAYLPGVRSRVWRTVAPGSPVAQPAPRAPILAVLQRLPLGEPPT